METSPKKNKRLEKNAARFGLKVIIKFEFEFIIFSVDNRRHKLFYVKFWCFKPFDNFDVLYAKFGFD
jgi:hypothetical protein